MRCTFALIGSTFLSLIVFVAAISAQTATPTPAAAEETIRVATEEVNLTVHAQGAIPGVAPKLRIDDISVFEDGNRQTITSMRNTPASVLVLVDTGAALTFVKSSQTAKLTTKLIVGSLPEGTAVAVAQYNDRTEKIADWTDDRDDAFARIDSSVYVGRRSMLTKAFGAASAMFISRPVENRHLILITDGLDGAKAVDRAAVELRGLAAANIVLHVVSLAGIEQAGAEESGKVIKFNTKPSKPRIPPVIFEEMIRNIPAPPQLKEEVKGFLRAQNEGMRFLVIDLDLARKRMLNGRRDEWKRAEEQLTLVATETGGSVSASGNLEELWTGAAEIARSIGMHYAVTYMPTVSFNDDKKARTIEVKSAIESIRVRTRKTVVHAN
jgi:von Willebrand factor type A domain.